MAAGITITSIPLPSFAATISQPGSDMAVTVEETEQESGTIGETGSESAADETEETVPETNSEESSTGKESETDPVTEESSSESTGETESETASEEESTELENETETTVEETETETVEETETTTEETETETETETGKAAEEALFRKQAAELEKQAKEALKELAGSEYVMALLYLCDSYNVKAEADYDAETVATIYSGATVFIQDVAVNVTTGTIWYKTAFTVDGQEYSGYIEKKYLAYSNENFLAWEENYVAAIEQLFDKNSGSILPQIYNDGASTTYSSDVDQFPDSYRSALNSLKNAHPNWTFVKFNTNLEWDTVVYHEVNPKERSLVYKTAKDAWKNGQYDSNWYYASEAAVKYCLDPRNGLTESRIFQYEQLTYNESYHTVAAIQSMLNSTFMKGTVPKATVSYAQAFYDIGKARKLSPYHLAARVLQEQGTNGGSALISGNGYNGKYVGYYNYFNIGATSADPINTGLARAYKEGWNTPYKSLSGGAAFIGNNYILKGQDTLYLQKWDVDSATNLATHQYMQNIQAAMSEASTMRNLYNGAGALNGKFVFKIPVYNNMPGTACPDPTDIIKLSTNSIKLKGGYDTKITYTINDSKSTVSAKVGNSKIVKVEAVSGEKAYKITALSPGETSIVFTTSGGGSATCKVTVVKDTITLSQKEIEVTAGLSDGSVAGTPLEITYTIDNPKSEVKALTVEKGKEDYLTVEKLSEEVDEKNNTITGKLKITGVKPGDVKFTLTSQYGGSVSRTVKIIRLPEKLTMDTTEITISRGNSKTAHATILPEDTTNKNLIWSSADETIATVNPESGRITGVKAGTVKITATTEANTLVTGKPLTAECTVTVVPSVEEVRLAADETELLVNETFALNGEVYPADAKECGLYTVIYKSSDEEVATVDAQGIITAKAVGNAVITAVVKDSYASSGTRTAICKVNVVPERKEEVQIPDYGYVQPDEILMFRSKTNATVSGNTVSGNDASNETLEPVSTNTYAENPLKSGEQITLKYKLMPENAVSESVTWESSKPSVAEVTDLGNGTAVIRAVTKGNAVLTVATDIGVKKQLNITVTEKQPVEKVTLDKEEATIYVNGTEGGTEGVSSVVQLTPSPQAGTESGIVYIWSSSNENVALVDENGKVTAKAPGKTVITVIDAGGSGKYAACTVTVERCLEKLSANVDELYVQPGKKVTVAPVLSPEEYTAADLVWASGDESIAVVNEKGVVTVQKEAAGGAKTVISITDTITGLKKEIPLTVITTPAKSVSLYKEGSFEAGKPVSVKAAELYANGTESEQTFTFRAVGFDADKKAMEKLSFYAESSNSKVAVVEPNVDEKGNYDGTFQITAKGKGTATVKVYAADGSKKNASVKVTVKNYPEQVLLTKEALFITPGGSGTLAAKVMPADAADKKITWKFKDGKAVAGFTLNAATGKVTVAKGTPAGETAEFVAAAGNGSVESGITCKVTVVSKKVSKVTLNAKTLLMIGDKISEIPSEQLKVTVAPETADVKQIKFTSSDETVAAVDENGKLTAVGYGMTTVTAATLDNSKKAVCKVYVSAVDKGYKLSAVTKNIKIQQPLADVHSSAVLRIKDQFGNVLDNGMFTFTSSSPEVVEVNAEGIVTPNKTVTFEKNKTATVTAVLTGDPYKRKVSFKVTVLAKEQVESVSVTALAIRGQDITNADIAVKYPAETITFRAEAANVYGKKMDTDLKWTVSDSSMAVVKADRETGSAVVTIKKPGKFYLTCTANDTLKKSRTIRIEAVDAKPVLEEKKITVNKQAERDEQSFVQSDILHLIENKDCPISKVTVAKMEKGSNSVNVSKFEVREVSEGCYAVMIPESSLKSIDKGSYRTTLSVETKGLTELGMKETVTHEMQITVNISDAVPKLSVKAVTINRQNLADLSAKLDIKASDKIESVKLVDGQANKFDTQFAVTEDNGSYLLSLVKPGEYKLSSINGRMEIKVAGYQPVRVDVQVKTPLTQAAVVQSEIPSMDMERGTVQKLQLYDKKTKEKLEYFEITVPKNAKLDIQNNGDGTLGVKPVKSMVEKGQYKNGATVSVDIKVTATTAEGKAVWASPVDVKISVKGYTTTPKVILAAKTLQLNKQVTGERVEAAIKTDRSNVRIADDSEWQIEQYNPKDKSYSVIKNWDELPENMLGDIILSYNRQRGTVCATAKPGAELTAGNYKYRITWIAEDYSFVKCEVTVVVVDRKAGVKISSKGKLDLLTRNTSTMQGTVKLTNTKSTVKSITIMEEDENGGYKRNEKFYSSWLGDNAFRIRLREGVKETTGKKTVPVKIVLDGGSVLYANVSFKITQSTPKVVMPKAKTIYKSESNTTVVYDMNTQIPDGYEINTIKAAAVPNGLGITVENGRISVSLADRHIKPGTYSIKVNMYFKGAQDVFGSNYGKAFPKTLKVTVKE